MTDVGSLVLVLDDELSVLRSLARLFAAHGYAVLLYSRAEDFFRAGFPIRPACLVLDQNLGPVKGTEVYAEMKRKGWVLPTVFLTADSDTRNVVSAMRDGADDYLIKPFDPDELVAAVRRALQRVVAAQWADGKLAESQHRAATLTKRERLIVGLIVAGLLNKQIAAYLELAVVTVKVHRSRAMRKLGAKNSAELVRLATLVGIMVPPP